MARYRKKPVVIDAWRWRWDGRDMTAPTWATDALNVWPRVGGLEFDPNHADGPRMRMATREGVMTVRPGDWLIRGVAGELYSCKHDIFERTYEEASDVAESAGCTRVT